MSTRDRITVVARTGRGRDRSARWPSWPAIRTRSRPMAGRRRSMLVSLAVAATIGVGLAPVLAAAQVGAAARPGNVTIYLAPVSKGGKDGNTGLTSSSPILTLAHAQQVLTRLNPTGNVTVRITQGTYVASAITWSFYVPGHTISFMPVNYSGGGRPPGGDPVFADPASGGVHVGQTWFTAVLPPAPSPLHDGGNTGLRFYYLAVEDYTQGISFNGQAGHSWHNSTFYVQPSAGVNGNDVSGMTFQDIGDRSPPRRPATAPSCSRTPPTMTSTTTPSTTSITRATKTSSTPCTSRTSARTTPSTRTCSRTPTAKPSRCATAATTTTSPTTRSADRWRRRLPGRLLRSGMREYRQPQEVPRVRLMGQQLRDNTIAPAPSGT